MPIWSMVMLFWPTLSVIDCMASVELEPRLSLVVWLPILMVRVSLPMSMVTWRLPWLISCVSLPCLTVTLRFPCSMVTVSLPVLTVSVRSL